MKILHTFLFVLSFFPAFSQTNVRGWYADGQVWIVWEEAGAAPETYAVFDSPATFTNTGDAVLLVFSKKQTDAKIRVLALNGQCYFTLKTRLMEMENRLTLEGLEVLPAGTNVIEVVTNGAVSATKWCKL